MIRLITIVIALAADYYLGKSEYAKYKQFRRLDWFHSLVAMVEKHVGEQPVWKGPIGVGAVLLLPLIVFGILLSIFKIPVFAWLLGLLVLLICLDPNDLPGQLKTMCAALEGKDEAKAAECAQALAGSDPGPEARGKEVAGAALVNANDSIFGVLLWYLILGPVGAILFRFSSELKAYATKVGSGLAETVEDLYKILIWLPARLLAVMYGIGGNLAAAAKTWRFLERTGLDESVSLLKDSGLASLQPEGCPVAGAQGLICRALVIWLIFFTILFIMF